MYKVMAFLARKPGISAAQFREHYERHHVALIGQVTPPMRSYRRNYLAREEPFRRADEQIGFDVVTEMEFEDRAACERWFDAFRAPGVADRVAEDEEKFLDRARLMVCPVEIETAPERVAKTGKMHDIERLVAIEAIKSLKARYCRCVDTHDWARFRTLFTDDASLFFPENYSAPSSIDDFMGGVETALFGCVSIHQAGMAEIDVTSETTATGVWAMTDRLFFASDAAGFGQASEIEGAGHYHETYEKRDGRWLFKSVRLSRLKLDVRMKPRRID